MFKSGEIVVVNIQVETDANYGLWLVIEHRAVNYPDGMLEEVECLSPCGTVIAWSPQYLSYPDQKV
ncbi:MAG: hypothetical protein CMO97_02035 [Woeseia sp.]|nr:hypothetical protein [Woeseia sp.]